MKIYNFNEYQQNTKTYGGTAGVKVGITIDGQDYLLKYPGKLKDRNMKNVELSYSNSPVCEYIGCKIYQSIGLPTQNVWLGIRNEKIVVACEDFLRRGDTLVPFRDIRATFEPTFTEPQSDITNGTGTVLSNILRTLDEHPLCQQMPEFKDRFWDMFVVDSLIGNPDRNNENWGLIRDLDDNFRLAPVYDCGNCLNNKLSERQMEEYLGDKSAIKDLALQRPCIFEKTETKRINACKYISGMQNRDCNEAIKRIVPKINMQEIKNIVCDVPDEILGKTTKKFYLEVMGMRYEKVLYPAYLQEQKLQHEAEREEKPLDDFDR